MLLSYIPQCAIQNTNVHISVLDSALLDMCMVGFVELVDFGCTINMINVTYPPVFVVLFKIAHWNLGKNTAAGARYFQLHLLLYNFQNKFFLNMQLAMTLHWFGLMPNRDVKPNNS